MAIVKRLTPEDRLDSKTAGSWRRILNVPLIRALHNHRHITYVDGTVDGITEMANKMADKSWMSRLPMNEKIFLYCWGMIARRAGVPGVLDDDRMTQLARHMNAQTTIDKLDASDGLAFYHAILFELPAFLQKYTKADSFSLPEPFAGHADMRFSIAHSSPSGFYRADAAPEAPAPARPPRQRLAKHSKPEPVRRTRLKKHRRK